MAEGIEARGLQAGSVVLINSSNNENNRPPGRIKGIVHRMYVSVSSVGKSPFLYLTEPENRSNTILDVLGLPRSWSVDFCAERGSRFCYSKI